ncbi:hypothetical protein AB0N73_04025 [Microbacterium sp. NPDC089189]|uniref:hypothetical protein n=1 Tax=Microbacterium sp. NPDC089189 TaxID=3154972 RepID=UPI00341B3A07
MALHPMTQLSVEIGAHCGRGKYSTDPAMHAAVVDDLRRLAGVHTGPLHEEVGRWVGYYGDEYTQARTSALLDAFPGAVAHVATGIERRNAGKHKTYETNLPPGGYR